MEEPAVNPVAAAEQSGIDQEEAARRAEAEMRGALHAPDSAPVNPAGAIQKREVG